MARHVSQSAVGDSEVCLRRLQYRSDPNIKRTTSEARLVGTGYHGALEAYYKGRQLGVELPLAELRMAAYKAIEDDVNSYEFTAWETSFPDVLAKACSMVEAYFAGGHQWGPEYTVVAVEEQIKVPLRTPGWDLKGFIDLVLRGPDGVIIIDEHKSAAKKWQKGKESPRGRVQGPLYLAAWWLLHNEMGRFCYSIMTYDGVFERRFIVPEGETIQGTWEKAETLPPFIEATVDAGIVLPGNTTSFLCSSRWCDYWNVCPLGAAMHRAVETSESPVD